VQFFTRISFSTNRESFYLGQSNEPRRKNEQIGSVVCSILAVSEKVCVRWSWQDNLTELNLMFDNNSGTKRFRFISEHSLTFADAIQGVDGHNLLIPWNSSVVMILIFKVVTILRGFFHGFKGKS